MRGRKGYDMKALALWKAGKGPKPAVSGYDIERVGRSMNFTSRFIQTGIEEGWLAIADGAISIRGSDGLVTSFEIVRSPGLYCCYCDQKLEGAAAEHVEKHDGPSPDPRNPSGYRKDTTYVTRTRLSVRPILEKQKGWLGKLFTGR